MALVPLSRRGKNTMLIEGLRKHPATEFTLELFARVHNELKNAEFFVLFLPENGIFRCLGSLPFPPPRFKSPCHYLLSFIMHPFH